MNIQQQNMRVKTFNQRLKFFLQDIKMLAKLVKFDCYQQDQQQNNVGRLMECLMVFFDQSRRNVGNATDSK